MLSFQKLFDENADHVSELSLTMLDTFIMIHGMYVNMMLWLGTDSSFDSDVSVCERCSGSATMSSGRAVRTISPPS